MTSPLRLPVASTILLASTLLPAAPAAAEPAGRAVAQCRAELLAQFPEGAVRNHRVAEISGNSRRTTVRIGVNADQRYVYQCTAGADGSLLTAAFDPPRDRQLASGQR